jgi:dsDNA-specific endonuclease/ATPase MutS2
MSEENTPVVDETVSENATNEVSTDSTDVGALIAESKKYRKRSQDAEARLAKLESQLSKAEEAKLKEKEDFKTLYEQNEAKIESLTSNADKWTNYQETKTAALLESVPEDEREALSKLDFETLEYVTSKINNAKANAPEVVGGTRQPDKPVGDWTKMDDRERRDNWANIVASAKKN